MDGTFLPIVFFVILAPILLVVFHTRPGYMLAYFIWRLRPYNWRRGQYIEANGVKIYFEVHGQGEPLVLLHGGGTLIDCFYAQLPTFCRHFKVIAIDSRGHGRSSHGVAPLTYARMADDVIAVLDHLAIASSHLVGWSDGGITGLLMAIGHPGRLGRMVVIGANFHPEGITIKERKAIRETSAEKAHPVLRFLYAVFSPHPERWPRLWSDLKIMWENQPDLTTADLAAVTVPTLILIGDHDLITREHAEQMHAAIPGSRLYVISGASHSLPMEKPGRLNRLILQFLKGRGDHRLAAHQPDGRYQSFITC